MDAVAEYLEDAANRCPTRWRPLLDVQGETGRSTQYFGLHQYFLHAARRRRHSGAYREKLGIRLGESTADGKFSEAERGNVWPCCGAPMMQIDHVSITNI